MAPRRATKRWTQGQPEFILACYDNGGKTFDRYTILIGGTWRDDAMMYVSDVEYFAASEDPSHPQGFGQWGQMRSYNRPSHDQIKWLDLPEKVRNYLINAHKNN